MTDKCPKCEGEHTYLSQGIGRRIFFCKKCEFVWSDASWQKDRDKHILAFTEKKEKKVAKKRNKKSNPSISMGLGV